jgi:hypothetical protein
MELSTERVGYFLSLQSLIVADGERIRTRMSGNSCSSLRCYNCLLQRHANLRPPDLLNLGIISHPITLCLLADVLPWWTQIHVPLLSHAYFIIYARQPKTYSKWTAYFYLASNFIAHRAVVNNGEGTG